MPTLQTFGMVILAISFANSQNTVPFSRNTASETSASPAAISDAADVALGEPFEWALPKYPQQALRARLQGNVVLMLSVDEEGYVTEARPTSGDPQLVESALGAVRKWKYVPYDLNGRGVGVTTKVAFVFSISETGIPNVSAAIRNLPKTDLGPVFQVGTGVTRPKPVYAPDPQYSRQAKADRCQGTCVLSLVVAADGKPYEVKVSRLLGEGLDEKAIEAVRNWRFQPGLRDGKPVAVALELEIKFVLD